MTDHSRKIWGWYAFDWASQPYNTLIVTFIFAPYFVQVMDDPVTAQTVWARALTWTGIASAIAAPIVGALADRSGRLVGWVAGLSIVYVVACVILWFMVPGMQAVWPILLAFGLGLIAAEMAVIVTNAFLPSLGPAEAIGRISGNGFAIGFAGGLLALFIMLAFFAQNDDGQTFLGLDPGFGLNPDTYQGTRFVGPFCALWFLIFMVPFFLFVRDPVREGPNMSIGDAVRGAAQNIRDMLGRTAGRRSLLAFLASSMFYRDALNGLYLFGGIYASGVLGWSITDVGIFGLLGVTSAGLTCWACGHVDSNHGPRPVILSCILTLIFVCAIIVGLSREQVFGLPLPEGSVLPDVLFYICGAVIGGAGGALQSASRSMMVRHAEPDRPTEAFGLYAMTGKATAFLAPMLVALATEMTGDQRLGVSPLIVLFLLGLFLLPWVQKDGDI